MPRKKCIICKEECAKIQYGMPARMPLPEDNIVLGGCCITGNDPKWKCKECSIEYWSGGNGLFIDEYPLDLADPEEKEFKYPENVQEMLTRNFHEEPPKGKKLKFTFSHSSYGGSNNNIICYYDGYLIYRDLGYLPIINSDTPSPKVYILSNKLKKDLETFIKTSKWKKKYFNDELLDGTQWDLKVFNDGKVKESFGSNEYPKVYQNFFFYIDTILHFNTSTF